MKRIKKFILKLFTWYLWKNFHFSLKSVLGHRTLSSSLSEMKTIEASIRLENNLKTDEKITWDNSAVTLRETFARYWTLKHYNEVGELLAFFKSVEKNRILEAS